MSRTASILILALVAAGLPAQTPQPRLGYEDRSGTTGHTLVVDGKSFGPYKTVDSSVYSTSGTAGLFLVSKRDKVYVVAQGRESGPLGAGFEADQTSISDDGKVAGVIAVAYAEDDSGANQAQLWVNGHQYGPYVGVYPFEYAETGGNWIAGVELGENSFDVLLNGKTQGPFSAVDAVWMAPDGKTWGYAARNSEGVLTVVTQDQRFDAAQSGNFDQTNLRSAHWAFSVRTSDEEELVVVDGKTYRGYLNFGGLTATASGRHWAFEAEKMTDSGDYPVVLVDGKEYVGSGLTATALGAQEMYSWTIQDGTKVTIEVLALP
jgi:hypothetical protein